MPLARRGWPYDPAAAPGAGARRPPCDGRPPAEDGGPLVEWTAHILGRELEIVRKDPDQRGFQVQPERGAVERTFWWLTAHRRLARDYETGPAHSEPVIRWAMIGIMVRRLARGRPATRQWPVWRQSGPPEWRRWASCPPVLSTYRARCSVRAARLRLRSRSPVSR